jgi:hypothetical protein
MGNMIIEKLAIIVRLKNNKYHQVALTDQHIMTVKAILPSLFDNGIVALMPKEIEGVSIDKR